MQRTIQVRGCTKKFFWIHPRCLYCVLIEIAVFVTQWELQFDAGPNFWRNSMFLMNNIRTQNISTPSRLDVYVASCTCVVTALSCWWGSSYPVGAPQLSWHASITNVTKIVFHSPDAPISYASLEFRLPWHANAANQFDSPFSDLAKWCFNENINRVTYNANILKC